MLPSSCERFAPSSLTSSVASNATEPSAPPSPNKLNASYNTAVQRWFKKQLPLWVRCTEGWREELSLIGECEAKWEALAALDEWKKTYTFASKEKRNRRDRCEVIERYLALVEIALRHQLPASSLRSGLYTVESLPTRADYATSVHKRKLRLPPHLHIGHALQVLNADMRPTAEGAPTDVSGQCFDDVGSWLEKGEECTELILAPRKSSHLHQRDDDEAIAEETEALRQLLAPMPPRPPPATADPRALTFFPVARHSTG